MPDLNLSSELERPGLDKNRAEVVRRSTKNLEALLEAVTPEKIHREIFLGNLVGNEIW